MLPYLPYWSEPKWFIGDSHLMLSSKEMKGLREPKLGEPATSQSHYTIMERIMQRLRTHDVQMNCRNVCYFGNYMHLLVEEAKYRLFGLQAFLKVQIRPDKGYQGYSVRVVISKGVSSYQPSKEEAQPEPRYADQQNQYMNKLLEDACKLKCKYAALKADKFIANESLKAKTAAYNKLMGQHKRLKKEKVQVESKPKEYKDQEGDATQERPRSESVRADRSCVDVLRIYCLIVARTVSKIFTR